MDLESNVGRPRDQFSSVTHARKSLPLRPTFPKYGWKTPIHYPFWITPPPLLTIGVVLEMWVDGDTSRYRLQENKEYKYNLNYTFHSSFQGSKEKTTYNSVVMFLMSQVVD